MSSAKLTSTSTAKHVNKLARHVWPTHWSIATCYGSAPGFLCMLLQKCLTCLFAQHDSGSKFWIGQHLGLGYRITLLIYIGKRCSMAGISTQEPLAWTKPTFTEIVITNTTTHFNDFFWTTAMSGTPNSLCHVAQNSVGNFNSAQLPM